MLSKVIHRRRSTDPNSPLSSKDVTGRKTMPPPVNVDRQRRRRRRQHFRDYSKSDVPSPPQSRDDDAPLSRSVPSPASSTKRSMSLGDTSLVRHTLSDFSSSSVSEHQSSVKAVKLKPTRSRRKSIEYVSSTESKGDAPVDEVSTSIEVARIAGEDWCLADQVACMLCSFEHNADVTKLVQDDNQSAPSSQNKESPPKNGTSLLGNDPLSIDCMHLTSGIEMPICSELPVTNLLAGLQAWMEENTLSGGGANNGTSSAGMRSQTKTVPTFPSAPRNRITQPNDRNCHRNELRTSPSHHVGEMMKSWHASEDPLDNQQWLQSTMSDGDMDIGNVTSDDNEPLFYDSDPGDVESANQRRRRMDPPKRLRETCTRLQHEKESPKFQRSRPISIEMPSDNEVEVETAPVVPPAPRNQRVRRDACGVQSFFPISPRSVADLDLSPRGDEEDIKTFIQEAISGKFQLVWHRTNKDIQPHDGKEDASHAPASPPPAAVTGWLEVGAHLDYFVVQPKFAWSPAYHPGLARRRRLAVSGTSPDSIELLSIVRVVRPQDEARLFDRERFPFCRLDRALCVATNDNRQYVFETDSPKQRDWLAQALKLLVARLASIIIVRDEVKLWEFFSPTSGNVVVASKAEEEEEVSASDSYGSDATANPTIFTPHLISTNDEDRKRLWGK